MSVRWEQEKEVDNLVALMYQLVSDLKIGACEIGCEITVKQATTLLLAAAKLTGELAEGLPEGGADVT